MTLLTNLAMFRTRSPVGSSPMSRSPTQREVYLHSLEQEREDILTEAYSHKASSPSDLYSPGVSDFGYYAKDSSSNQVMFDERGRQRDFRESVSQRQERLEFIRRQEHARRLAQKARLDPSVSNYAIVSTCLSLLTYTFSKTYSFSETPPDSSSEVP